MPDPFTTNLLAGRRFDLIERERVRRSLAACKWLEANTRAMKERQPCSK